MLALFSRILKLSGKYKCRIQGAFVCAFLESILSKMPIFLAFLVLSGFYQKTLTGTKCLYIGIGLVGVVAAQVIVHYLCDRLQSAAGYMIFTDKRMELGGHLRKLPMGYFTSGNIGKISSVLSTDMVFIEEIAMSTLGNMMSYMLSALILLVFMFFLDWRLGLAAAAVTLLACFTAKGMNKVSLKEAACRQDQSEHLTDAVLSFAEGISVIKSYNLIGEKSEELTGNFRRSRDTSTAFERKMTPWTRGLNILYAVGIAAIFALSVWLQQSGSLSLPYLLGVLLFVFDLFSPLKALYGEASRLTVMNAALDRIEAVLNETELPDKGTAHIPNESSGSPEICFDNVTFAYQDKEVLHNISFSMQKNTMTALVGPSGGGKSTIANLLARLWDVKSGKVTIRSTDIRDVPLAELMEQISMVFQRVYLFQDTIYNNISMGKPDATEEEVYEAAKKARCYDFIMALPDGFQTVIGEGGATLSGGEKQRISIARCILKDAPIVILDEATASVDTDNESYIQEAINELVKGKTLLVIAHRLNTIRQADQILVISDGRISEQGTHDELMAKAGIYQDFVNIRKKSSGWSLA
ncbi:ABC transporter ATP-binding protein/permease [Oscillospiraceae bacterium CLA-AA-H250]|jgi:ATP-binding cassette subfamily B protein|uniref:ABC transporter ATP-binding protein/permease n=2 Tax=Hominenteromicrobium TaxID=3073575 RepID=A0AAE3AIK9_9FIRM|nr:ABC transporter ATP-binding protein [Hominenteromicrobium mulieris]MCC2137047.1 ABC transporter ATP-binding protein/permease [Hominenteromicrobium mulieris]